MESFTLGELYPDTLYFVWVAGKSLRGEGAATPPIPVRTEQYSKWREICTSLCVSWVGSVGDVVR